MGYAKNIMAAGIPYAAAAADTISSVATAISAAGTTQATATAISADMNLVSTVGASSGVQIYNGVIGDSLFIFNDAGANALNVYPPTSGKFNNIATNSPIVLAANTLLWCIKVTSTRWLAILSA